MMGKSTMPSSDPSNTSENQPVTAGRTLTDALGAGSERTISPAATNVDADFGPATTSVLSTVDDPSVQNLLVRARPFKDIVTEKDPIKRLNDLAYALENLTSASAREALEAYEGVEDRQKYMEMGYLLYAWGKTDGPAAMQYIDEQDSQMMKFMGGSRVMSGWAAQDTDAAYAWAMENGPEGEENPYLAGVAAGAAMSDMGKAGEVLETMEYGRMRGHAVGEVLSTSIQQNGIAATQDWVEGLTEDVLRDGVASRVGERLAREDGEEAFEWVNSVVTEDKRSDAVRQVLGTWSRSDPQGLLAWAQNSDDTDLKASSTAMAVRSWSRKDPVATGEWLNTQEKGPQLDGSIATYADSVADKDPAAALNWAMNISDTEQRQEMLEEIANDWVRDDPVAAAEHFGTEPPTQEEIDAAAARQNRRGNGRFDGGRGGRRGF